MANWSDLPDELIYEMGTRLHDVDDHIRFGGVCHSWKSVAIQMKEKKTSWGPWVMLPEREEEEGGSCDVFRRFLSITSKKVFNLYLPETQGRRCWGSPFGFLFTIGLDLNIHLLNPLTRFQISLPSQPTFEDQYEDYTEPAFLRNLYVNKFTLSCNPSNSTTPQDHSCLVMVIYSEYRKLAITSPGDKAWTTLESPYGTYGDIIFFKNHFYALSCTGKLRVCDVIKPNPEAVDFMCPPDDVNTRIDGFYLVELSGDLLLVVRIFAIINTAPRQDLHQVTEQFKVYKLDFHTKKWIKLFNLGHYALFVGTNSSFAISTSDQPDFKSNSIYFTEDNYSCFPVGSCDVGVFDFDKGTVDPFCFGDDIRSSFCPALFISPIPW